MSARPQQGGGILPVLGPECHPDAATDLDTEAGGDERLAHGFVERAGEAQRRVRGDGTGPENGELITAKPGQKVGRAQERL